MFCIHLKEFICSWFSCVRDPEAEPLLTPIDERDFPPPTTVLTPPRPRPRLPGTGHSSSSSIVNWRSGQQSAGPSAQQSLERLQETAKISSIFSGRMMNVRTSQPHTPSTAHFGSTRRAPASASTPMFPRLLQPLSSPEDLVAVRTHPLPTPLPRTAPTSPRALGRSVSDPHLVEIEGFGRHQVARSRTGSMSVVRGRGISRPRAATINDADRTTLNIQPPVGFQEARRGRSPGPRPSPLGSNNPSLSALSLSQTAGPSQPSQPPASESGSDYVDTSEDQVGDVVRRDLGISDMFRGGGRGRGRARPGRGRAITH